MIYALIGLFILLTLFVLPWLNHSRIGALRSEVADMRQDIESLQQRLFLVESGEKTPEVYSKAESWRSPEASEIKAEHWGDISEYTPEEPELIAKPESFETQEHPEEFIDSPVRRQTVSEPSGNAGRSRFELDMGTKLPVWIGAISLIFAAFFLVKYSVESGWLSPLVRVGLGAAFGIGLVSAARWVVRHIGIANHVRIAQGLAGAGIVSLYVSFYAAVNLYGLLPPLFGFGAMTVVTAMAVILSLRHGQPIAVFGLVGGLLTPALTGSSEPNAAALFFYLFLLFGGMLFILARKGWWILASVALTGVFAWTGFWYYAAFTSGDAFALVLFAVGVCAIVLAATKAHIADRATSAKDRMPIHGLNIIAMSGSALTIIWLGSKIPLSLFDWSMLGLLSLGCTGLAWFQPTIYQRMLWAKLAADLTLFLVWALDASTGNILAVLAGFSAIYVVLPHFIMRRIHDPRFWAGTQAMASVALYIISWDQLSLPAYLVDHGFWGMTALVLAGIAIHQVREMRIRFQGEELVRDHLSAVYALAATSFISLGLSIELPQDYLPLAFASQTMATLWVFNRTGIAFLQKIVLILIGVFTALNYKQIALFSTLTLSSLSGAFPAQPLIESAALDLPLIKLGLPSLFMGLTLLLHWRQENPDRFLSHVLFGATLALILGTGYYAIRGGLFLTDTRFLSIPAGFIERGVFTLFVAALGFLVVTGARRLDAGFMEIWGRSLFHLAMLRIFWFDLVIFNPYMDKNQFVGDWPLFNGVTMTYGTGVVLAVWAVRNRTWSRGEVFIEKSCALFGLAMLFALSSLTVRQYFHGGVLASGIKSHSEFYSYSVAWLAVGLGLLTFGIVRKNRTARMASLAFVLLTIGKVFLLDAAELEGLYRVFSFLGLGLSLIGLSYFYTRFIGKSED